MSFFQESKELWIIILLFFHFKKASKGIWEISLHLHISFDLWQLDGILHYCRDAACIQFDLQSKNFSEHVEKLWARQIINTKRKLRQAAVPYSTNVWDRLHANWRRTIWDIASKLPLLLSDFSLLSIVKHSAPVRAEFISFYSYMNAFFQYPIPYLCTFEWMCRASKESCSFRIHSEKSHSSKSSVLYTELNILFL